MIGDTNDEANFLHKLLLTDRLISKIHKSFENNPSANIKLLKTQLSKIIQPQGFPVGLPGPLLKIGLPTMNNVLEPLPKIVLISIRLKVAAVGAGIQKKIV